jgi:hypothetical protein
VLWRFASEPLWLPRLCPRRQDDDKEVEFVPPKPGEALSFDTHIKPLFRDRDRRSMRFAFDLWSYDDVAAHADEILKRVTAGTMQCDGAWPKEQVDAFKGWIDAGYLR